MKPVETFRQGQVVASVWDNKGNNGSFRTVSLCKNYKNKAGEWKSAYSFGTKDAEGLIVVVKQALLFMRGGSFEEAKV